MMCEGEGQRLDITWRLQSEGPGDLWQAKVSLAFCTRHAVLVNGQTLCAGAMVAASGGGLVFHSRSWSDAGHQHQFPH